MRVTSLNMDGRRNPFGPPEDCSFVVENLTDEEIELIYMWMNKEVDYKIPISLIFGGKECDFQGCFPSELNFNFRSAQIQFERLIIR